MPRAKKQKALSPPKPSDLMRLSEAARALGIDARVMRQWVDKEVIDVFYEDGKALVRESDLKHIPLTSGNPEGKASGLAERRYDIFREERETALVEVQGRIEHHIGKALESIVNATKEGDPEVFTQHGLFRMKQQLAQNLLLNEYLHDLPSIVATYRADIRSHDGPVRQRALANWQSAVLPRLKSVESTFTVELPEDESRRRISPILEEIKKTSEQRKEVLDAEYRVIEP
jgi:hypothetical protein